MSRAILLLLLSFSQVCFGQEEHICDTVNIPDPSIAIFAKTIRYIRLAFMDEKEGNCISVYCLCSAIKDRRIYVERENHYSVPPQEKDNTYTAVALKRWSESDTVFRNICWMIDSSFFEGTNKDKISILEAFIEKQARKAKEESLYRLPSFVRAGTTNDILFRLEKKDNPLLKDTISCNEGIQILNEIKSKSRKRRHYQQKIANIDAVFILIDANNASHYLIITDNKLFDLSSRTEYICKHTYLLDRLKETGKQGLPNGTR